MPGEDLQSWSTTAATNANADTSINWTEGQPRASVNNSARSMMAAHAKDRNLRNGSITTAGTANAQTFTSGVTYTAVPTGLVVRLKIGVTNTGATTLNMDSIGAVAIKDQAGFDIGANTLLLGRYVDFIYNGTNWIVLQAGSAAASFEALAYNGMQINGSMEVSQENGTAAVTLSTGTAAYIIDAWQAKFVRAATLAISCQQVTPPGSPSFQSAFQNALQIKATTGLGSLASGDYGFLEQTIEGYRVSRLDFGSSGAASVTVGFWVYATIAGTMTVALLNSAVSRAIPVNVVISNATTWEYKTVTFAGDTSGTWLFTNGIGLRVRFCFGSGSTFQGTNNTWTGSEVFATSATTNFFASSNNLACITGVIVLPGADVPSAARSPFIMRPYDQELLTCQRYFWKRPYATNSLVANLQAVSATAVNGFMWNYPVQMRSLPTVVPSANAHFSCQPAVGGNAVVTGMAGGTTLDQWWISSISVGGGLVAGNVTALFANQAAYFYGDARL